LVQDLFAQLLAVALAERDVVLADQLIDSAPELPRGLLDLEAREVREVDALEELEVDLELQLLIPPVDRRRAWRRRGRRSRDGLGGRWRQLRLLLIQPDPIHQFHARASRWKIRWKRCVRFAFGDGSSPASLLPSCAIAVMSGTSRPLPASGVPAFIAAAAASSRGMTKKGSRPMARPASASGIGPGIACVTSSSTRSRDSPSRMRSSRTRRAARMPGTERSVISRTRSLCSNAASVAPPMTREVSIRV